MFNLNDAVRIGGRTMLAPGFSLVGLTGRVVSSRADAPPGTVAVYVNWEAHGYTEIDKLPPVVNVPVQHLEPVDPDAIEPGVASRSTAAAEPQSPAEPQTEPPARNHLRLVD